MGRLLALIAALILGVLIARTGERTPAPRPASAPATAFSAARAMPDVVVMGRAPHVIGTPENARVRDYLMARMTALGLSPQVRADASISIGNSAERVGVTGARVENLVGVLPGRDRSQPAVVLMSHYDTVPGSPGAADDAAGVSASLEIVRAIKAQGTPARDVIVLITDGEESGLLGAKAFFQRDPLARRVGLVLNLETRGGGGRVQMFETSTDNGGLIRLLQRTAVRPASSSLSVFFYRAMPNNTDMTDALAAGVPGLNYAFIGRQFDYHAATSTPENLDPGSLQDMGDQVLSTARAAAFDPALPAKAPDAVYSQVFGNWIVAYPAWVGWLVLLGALGLIGLGYAQARRREPIPWTDIARGVGATLFAVLGSGAVLHFARRVTGADFGYVEQRFLLAQVSRWEAAVALLALGFLLMAAAELARGRRKAALLPLLAGLGCQVFGGWDPIGLGLGLAAALAALVAYGRPAGRAGAWTGVLATGALVALGLQIAAPSTAYVFAWPLLAAGAGAALTAMATRRDYASLAGLGLIAAASLAWIGGTAHVLFLGLDILAILALPVWVLALSLWPLAHTEEGAPPARLLGPVLLAMGLVALIAVRLNTPWSVRHPEATYVAYHLDQDTGQAFRVSALAETAWTAGVLAADGGRSANREHFAFPRPHLAAPARAVGAPAPAITLTPQPDGAWLLRAVPPAGAREINLQLRAAAAWTVESVEGLAVGKTSPAGAWSRLNWEAQPQGFTAVLRPSGPGVLDLRYVATLDGWPAGAAPLPARPGAEMPFDTSDSTFVSGSRRFTW